MKDIIYDIEKQLHDIQCQLAKFDGMAVVLIPLIHRLNQKIDYLNEKVSHLCLVEGSLATQGHCLFQQKEHDRKAE